MAGEANNLASHQGPEPNILNGKQLNFNVQLYIFLLKIKHREVAYSKQTAMRKACTRVILLSTSGSGCVYCLPMRLQLKYHCWPEVHFWTSQCSCCCTIWKHPAHGPERINFPAFNAKPFCRFWTV